MKKYTTIIFDLDGTLLDTLNDITDAVNLTLLQTGINKKITSKKIKEFIGDGAEILMQRVFNYLSLNDEQKEKFKLLYFDNYSKTSNNKTKPFFKVIETLKYLKEKGYILGVISNKPNRDAQECVNLFFNNIFDFVIGKRNNIPPKPNKQVFENIEFLKETNKNNILYVGDMQVDVLFSENIGVDVIICKYGYGKIEEINNFTYTIDSFEQIIDILEQKL